MLKVEPPGGELTRYGGAVADLSAEGLGLPYCTQNADKDCIEIDLKRPQGVAKVLELVAAADIFVQNYRPGVAERLGIGEAMVRSAKSDIIYCSISAYGGEGPVGHRPAYDHVVQAMSGIMQTTGTEEMGPVKVGAPYVDYATGLNAAFAIMAALRERDRTAEPQTVDVAMLDTALNLMANNMVATATTGNEIPKLGNEAASRAPSSGCFASSDGVLIMLAANNERQFMDLCAVLGHAEWTEDERWRHPRQRVDHQDALRVEIETAFQRRGAAEWETLLDQAGVPASRVRSLGEVLAEGQPNARDLLRQLPVGTQNTTVSLPAIGFRLNGDSLQPKRAPRKNGHDNDKYLT